MTIDQIEASLEAEFREPRLGPARFPLLFARGLPDAAVHAAGVSYLLALGLDLGIPAIAEYPISRVEGQLKGIGRVFPDSVWFHPETFQPWLALEFERFEPGDENKIREKVENLALSYHHSGGTIERCVFIFWLRTSVAPRDVSMLFHVFEKGFRRNGIDVPPPDCPLLVYKAVIRQARNDADRTRREMQEERAPYSVARAARAPLLVVEGVRRIPR